MVLIQLPPLSVRNEKLKEMPLVGEFYARSLTDEEDACNWKLFSN